MAKKSGRKPGRAAKKPTGGRKKFAAPTNTKTGASGDEAVKAAGEQPAQIPTRKITSGKALNDLLRECRGLTKEASSITGSIREKIGYAKEHKHLNPPAFALLRKFDKMEAEAASILYYDFMAYMESSGVLEKIESVGRLPLEGEQHPAPRKDKTGGNPTGRPVAAEKPKPEPMPEPEQQEAATTANAGEPVPGNGAVVRKPNFGERQPAPGGDVVMLDDKRQAAGGKPN